MQEKFCNKFKLLDLKDKKSRKNADLAYNIVQSYSSRNLICSNTLPVGLQNKDLCGGGGGCVRPWGGLKV